MSDMIGLGAAALLVSAVALGVAVAAPFLLSSVVLWGLCAGVIVGRSNAHFLGTTLYEAALPPLMALALSLVMTALLGEWNSWVLLAACSAVWATLRLVFKTRRSALRLGVYVPNGQWPADLPPLPDPMRQALQYVPLNLADDSPLSELDALLISPEQSWGAYQLLQQASAVGLPLWPLSSLNEELSGRVSLEQLNTAWLKTASLQSRYVIFKRWLDVLLILLFLPVLVPLLLLVAGLVWVNGRRPVLFWQERVGLGGVPFQIVKFRTMRLDAERAGPAFASARDSRVTPLGAFLRKFRLDELPQFWNVLRGEMSIIGPRPEQWAFAADFEESLPLYPVRHWVRPGITGWAQVNQGYAADLGQTVEKLRYDLYYVKHLSVGLDFRIVLKTVYTIVTGFGAR